MEKADTGDLLLFNCNNVGAFLTRTVTVSQYDHVAMVLKFESSPNDIYLVDATSTNGVALTKWSTIRKNLGKNKFYRKIVFRHLEAKRDQSTCDKLESFLK